MAASMIEEIKEEGPLHTHKIEKVLNCKLELAGLFASTSNDNMRLSNNPNIDKRSLNSDSLDSNRDDY